MSDRDDAEARPGAAGPATARPERPPHRRRAALATLPFLLLGLALVAFGVVASPRPLFGFLILPPVVFVSALTYLAFRSRFEADADADAGSTAECDADVAADSAIGSEVD